MLLAAAVLQPANVQADEGGPVQQAARSAATPQWYGSYRCSRLVPNCRSCYVTFIDEKEPFYDASASPSHFLHPKVYVCAACQPGYTLSGTTDLTANPPVVPSCVRSGSGEGVPVTVLTLLT